MKEFSTHNMQIKELRKKGLVIKNASKVKRVLESENYYSIINGYRDIFKNPTSSSPFRFIEGLVFEEIYALYELDGELRNLYMKYLLKIEKSFQSLVAYYFSKDNKTNNRAYLDFRNYRVPSLDAKTPRGLRLPRPNEIHKTISMLSNKMSNEHDVAIQHHITNHQEVPLWVLINSLTMGEVGYIYYYLKDDVRLEIAKHFSHLRNREYSTKSYHVTPSDVDKFLFSARHYRNACAHNERFYCKRVVGINNIKFLLENMKQFLTKKDYMLLEKLVKRKFDEYSLKFTSLSIEKIKEKSGF